MEIVKFIIYFALQWSLSIYLMMTWVLFVTANRHYQNYYKLHTKYNVRQNFYQLSQIKVLLDELKTRRNKVKYLVF